MRTARVILLTWLLTDCGVVLGWVIGRVFGRRTLFLASVVLGTLAILLAIRILATLGWLNPERRRGGSIGALVAFAIAAPFAAMNLGNAAIPLLVLALVGIGVVIGGGASAVQ